jgi:hypothetical protein
MSTDNITLKRLQDRPEGGPLASLKDRAYGFSSFNYPIDIENLSHALLFNINVHENSKDFGKGGLVTNFGGPKPGSREIYSNETPRYTQLEKNRHTLRIGLTRNTKRIARAISLYVPETVVFDGQQQYETPELMKEYGLLGAAGLSAVSGAGPGTTLGLGALAAAGAGVAVARMGGARAAQMLARMTGIGDIINDLNKKGTEAARVGASLFGYALNPVIEVLYKSPKLRTFRFDFVFSPRSKDEADKVWEIILEFRRHSAPEVLEYTGGTIFIAPSDFDITFMRKTTTGFVENTNIPRIGSCVLTDVLVDYASSGQYATFHDGMPIQIRMTLSFMELNLVMREDIDRGY